MTHHLLQTEHPQGVISTPLRTIASSQLPQFLTSFALASSTSSLPTTARSRSFV